MSEVKGQGRPLFLGFILLVLFWVQLAHGQRKSDFSKLAGGAKFSLPPTSIPPVFSSLVPIGTPQMTIDVARRSIINAALDETYPPDLSGDPNKANEEESLSFPPFPRVWTERSSESTDGYSAHATANLPIFYGTTAGLKMSKQFKYSVKTTFVIVASDPIRKSQAGATPQVRQVDGFEGGEQGILVFDSNSMHAYPNVSAQMQMVGMCSFEVSLSNEFLVQAGVNTSLFGNTIGGGSSTESGKSEVAKTTRFSRFMKLDRSISVDSYLNTICMDEFARSKKLEVEGDFEKIVLEMLFHHNINSTCKPSLGNPEESTPHGDRSCLYWHSDTIDPVLRRRTVPRCEIQADGAHRCVLKSREQANCPLYLDRRAGTYSSYRDQKHRIPVTSGVFENSCDRKMGLTCKMVEQPGLFFLGIPVWQGRAECQK